METIATIGPVQATTKDGREIIAIPQTVVKKGRIPNSYLMSQDMVEGCYVTVGLLKRWIKILEAQR